MALFVFDVLLHFSCAYQNLFLLISRLHTPYPFQLKPVHHVHVHIHIHVRLPTLNPISFPYHPDQSQDPPTSQPSAPLPVPRNNSSRPPQPSFGPLFHPLLHHSTRITAQSPPPTPIEHNSARLSLSLSLPPYFTYHSHSSRLTINQIPPGFHSFPITQQPSTDSEHPSPIPNITCSFEYHRTSPEML